MRSMTVTYRLRYGVLVVLLLAGCQTLRIQHAAMTSPEDWLTEGDTPARENASAQPLDPPLEEVWRYNAGAGFADVSPLILGDVVLVATRKGEVHAIRLEDGGKAGQNEFGESIEGTPVVGDGMLYVPIGWGRRALYAFDLTRAETRWKVKGAPINAGLLLTDDALVAADLEGHVRAYGLEKGKVLWERQLGERAGVQATPVLADGRVVVADDQGHVVALDPADGTLRWSQTLDAPVYAAPSAGGALIYVPTTRGRLYALDAATGAVRWRYAVPDTTVYLTPPALEGDDLAVGGSDGILRLLDARTGDVRWAHRMDGALSAAPLLTPHTVYVGNMQSELVALDRTTGAVAWTQELEGRVKSAMAARGARLVVLAEPRLVYLFEPATNQTASR